ncbi:MAG: signal peptidase I [Deltaproteobacteria bacterium]|nr:MAG: signal peptidase I [Deltaproteobacteria bacterium]
MEAKRRSPLVAGLLGLVGPGLGQLYCGRPLAALFFWLFAMSGWAGFYIVYGAAQGSLPAALAAFVIPSLAGWLGGIVHAAISASRASEGYELRWYNSVAAYLLAWLCLFCAANWAFVRLTRANLLTTVLFVSDTMRPTLLPGDALLVDLRSSSRIPRCGDVVAFRESEGGDLRIARVVGIEGQSVSVRADGVEVDGKFHRYRHVGQQAYNRVSGGESRKVLDVEISLDDVDHRLFVESEPAERRTAEWKIGRGRVLLLGDNRTEALSWRPALVDAKRIAGRVLAVRFSRDPATGRVRRERTRMRVE